MGGSALSGSCSRRSASVKARRLSATRSRVPTCRPYSTRATNSGRRILHSPVPWPAAVRQGRRSAEVNYDLTCAGVGGGSGGAASAHGQATPYGEGLGESSGTPVGGLQCLHLCARPAYHPRHRPLPGDAHEARVAVAALFAGRREWVVTLNQRHPGGAYEGAGDGFGCGCDMTRSSPPARQPPATSSSTVSRVAAAAASSASFSANRSTFARRP